MGRAPCCSKVGLHRGPWTPREDTLLTKYIEAHGEGNWRSLPKKAGLLRCGKSCRLRWMNYLRPDIKRGNITPDEDDLIIRMHSLLGNRWSLIAGRLPGRTDNEIKNYWNTHLTKRLKSQGTDPNTHRKLQESPIQKGTKKKKNSTSSGTNIKKVMMNTKRAKIEPEKKHKVHLPKPVRVTSLTFPRNDSFECHDNNNNNSGSYDIAMGPSLCNQGRPQEGLLIRATEVPWRDANKDSPENNMIGGFLGGEGLHLDQGLVNVSGYLECHRLPSPTTTNNALVDQLFEEYLQLLNTDEDDHMQLDSFAESFLP